MNGESLFAPTEKNAKGWYDLIIFFASLLYNINGVTSKLMDINLYIGQRVQALIRKFFFIS